MIRQKGVQVSLVLCRRHQRSVLDVDLLLELLDLGERLEDITLI
jgi:hypothetical protein